MFCPYCGTNLKNPHIIEERRSSMKGTIKYIAAECSYCNRDYEWMEHITPPNHIFKAGFKETVESRSER